MKIHQILAWFSNWKIILTMFSTSLAILPLSKIRIHIKLYNGYDSHELTRPPRIKTSSLSENIEDLEYQSNWFYKN